MKIKDMFELCTTDFINIQVFDKSTYERKLFRYRQEVLDKWGNFPLLSWKMDGTTICLTTKSEF